MFSAFRWHNPFYVKIKVLIAGTPLPKHHLVTRSASRYPLHKSSKIRISPCNKNVIFLDFLAKVEISTFAKVEICEKVLKTLI